MQLNNLQPLLALSARRGLSLLGLSVPRELTWHRLRSYEIPRALARAGTPSFVQRRCGKRLHLEPSKEFTPPSLEEFKKKEKLK